MDIPTIDEWFKALWDWITDLWQATITFLIYVYDALIGGLSWAVDRVKVALFISFWDWITDLRQAAITFLVNVYDVYFWDFSLWIGVTTIILLATSELLSTHSGRTAILIDRRRLELASYSLLYIFLLFISTVAIRIYFFLR